MTPERNYDDDEIDPDAAPDPAPFEAPKGLRKKRPGEEDGGQVEAMPAPPAPRPTPTPHGADVRMDRPPADRPKPNLPTPEDMGPINIRIPVPQGPKPSIPRPEDFGPVDIKMHRAEGANRPLPKAEDLGPFEVEQQKGMPKLPRLEAPPDQFDVVQSAHTPQPKPVDKDVNAILEGNVEVVDYRKTGNVDVSGEAPDPFGNRKRIGVVDTTFARYDMGGAAEEELSKLGGPLDVVRRTVPGIKDLAVECKILLEKHGCQIVVACGMVGGDDIDQQCAHEASLGIQWAKLLTNRHILEVFVHQNEAKDDRELAWLMDRRAREHAKNAWTMVLEPEKLREMAGTGQRQGFEDEGPVRLA